MRNSSAVPSWNYLISNPTVDVRYVSSRMAMHRSVHFDSMYALQVKQLVEWGAEGVIVGSALVKALASGDSPADGLQAMEKLAKELRGAMS